MRRNATNHQLPQPEGEAVRQGTRAEEVDPEESLFGEAGLVQALVGSVRLPWASKPNPWAPPGAAWSRSTRNGTDEARAAGPMTRLTSRAWNCNTVDPGRRVHRPVPGHRADGARR